MHLLISAAPDLTADLLCERLGNSVLRINWERWNDYDIEISDTSFSVSDSYGRKVTETSVENVIWRKPAKTVEPEPGEFYYCFHEFKYAIRAIVERIKRSDPRRLPIDPDHNSTVDKFRQLQIARRHFAIPQWKFTSAPSKQPIFNMRWVIKSLTGEPLPNETGSKVIYTTDAEPERLADGFPWFLQARVDAAFDVTVVFVDGELFAFALDRNSFPGLDWRRSIGQDVVDRGWCRFDLSSSVSTRLTAVMNELGLRFGRIDLLTDDLSSDEFWFLEVNPNGQWAWLDLRQDNGLFESVVTFLTTT
jgi:hypothetical protein